MLESNKNNPVNKISPDLGWQNMSVLLDNELPVSRKTPTFLFWGLGVFCLISVSYFVYMFSQNTSEPLPIPKQQIKVPVKPTVPTTEQMDIATRSASLLHNGRQASNMAPAEATKTGAPIQATPQQKNTLVPTNQAPQTAQQKLEPVAFSTKSKEVSSPMKQYTAGAGQYFSTPFTKAGPNTNIQGKTTIKNSTSMAQDLTNNKGFKTEHNPLVLTKNTSLKNNSVEANFVNKNQKGIIKNLNLSDLPFQSPNTENVQFALSQSDNKEIAFLPVKTEKKIQALSNSQKNIDVPQIKSPSNQIQFGLFLASSYGVKGTIGGRAGVSVSKKVANNFMVNVDPTYSRVHSFATDSSSVTGSSYVAGANEYILPLYTMYRPHKKFGISLGIFAGVYQKILKTPKKVNVMFLNATPLTTNGPITSNEIDEYYKAIGGKKTGMTYGASIGTHWYVKPNLRVNLGYDYSLSSFNQKQPALANSQISLGIGHLF